MTTNVSSNMSEHCEQGKSCKCSMHLPTAQQSLSEVEFERGIWTAALDGDLDKLRKHIANGSTNSCDNFGYTALHYAARANRLDVCRTLLSARAAVDAKTRSGSVTPLHRAASMGHEQIVELLLANGANVRWQDDDGNTALHRAASGGHLNTFRMLLGNCSETGQVRNNRGECARDLVTIDRRDDFSLTPAVAS